MIKGSCHCGLVNWEFDSTPNSATVCNCTVCRRYGVLWAYGKEGMDVRVSGHTARYMPGEHIGFHFCNSCGCVAYWRSINPDNDGIRRIAVNLRLAEITSISDIQIRRFDGLTSFKSLPDDGRCVVDLWP